MSLSDARVLVPGGVCLVLGARSKAAGHYLGTCRCTEPHEMMGKVTCGSHGLCPMGLEPLEVLQGARVSWEKLGGTRRNPEAGGFTSTSNTSKLLPGTAGATSTTSPAGDNGDPQGPWW